MEYENSIAKTILEAVLAFFLPFLVFWGLKGMESGIRVGLIMLIFNLLGKLLLKLHQKSDHEKINIKRLE